MVLDLTSDPAKAQAMGERGRSVILGNQGAVERTAKWLASLVGGCDG